MTNSRDHILGKLRQGKRPFPAAQLPTQYRRMVPTETEDPAALKALFVQEAEKVDCVIHAAANAEAAIAAIMQVVGMDTAVSCWDLAHIPVPGLEAALAQAHITRVGQDANVRVGITGVDAALAATGSLILMSGNGRYRAASLLPPVHIAVLIESQIIPDLESWWAQQRALGLEQTRQASNIAIISGPSRTADIAMQLVLGMHGPRELHLVIME